MSALLFWELAGIPAIFFGGVLFHFLYKYGGRRPWLAVISPVNESIWEHLKLAFYPVLVFSSVEFFFLKQTPAAYVTAEILAVYVMFCLILSIEWIYPKILGKNIFALDLLVFFVAISMGQLASYYVMTTCPSMQINQSLLFAILLVQATIFVVLSFYPPRIQLFRDSTDGKYGIKKIQK